MTAPKRDMAIGLPISTPVADLNPIKRRVPNLESGTPVDTRALWGNARNTAHQDMVHASYMVENPPASTVDLTKKDFDQTPLQLNVEQILNYDGNPRIFENENYADIKAGLKANGFVGALSVTRRRDAADEPYVLCAGANSTLKALRELYQETGEERFKRVNCVFHAYQGEESLLSLHLGENLNRGDMKFWEVAVGVSKLAKMLEEKAGRSFTLAEMETELSSRGIPAKKTHIARWLFAAERLGSLGPATICLTGPTVSSPIQPDLNLLKKLAAKFGIAEDTYWADIVNPALRAIGVEYEHTDPDDRSIHPASIRSACEVKLAEHVGGDESAGSIRRLAGILAKSPDSTLADLRAPIRTTTEVMRGFAHGAATQTPAPQTTEAAPAAPPAPQPTPTAGAVQAQFSPPTAVSIIPTAGPNDVGVDPSLSLLHQPLPRLDHEADPLTDLHESISALFEAAQMTDCLRWWPSMPYGFYVEVPSPDLHPIEDVVWGSNEFAIRKHKQIVWWLMAELSGQSESRCEHLMDKSSAFYRDLDDDHGLNAVKDSAMGMAGRDHSIMHLFTDPTDVTAYWLFKVIDRMRVLNGRQPGRWPPYNGPDFK